MLRFATVLAVMLMLAGCAEVQQRPVPVREPSSLLTDPAILRPGPAQGPLFLYVAPNEALGRYRRIMLDPVTVWRRQRPETGGASQAEAQILADALYTLLYDELSRDYQIVGEPGADTLRLQAGLSRQSETRRSPGRPGLAVISTAVPQFRLIRELQALPADGGLDARATLEIRLLDSPTGDLLEASLDQRPAMEPDDPATAEDVLTAWSRMLRARLCTARGGPDCEGRAP